MQNHQAAIVATAALLSSLGRWSPPHVAPAPRDTGASIPAPEAGWRLRYIDLAVQIEPATKQLTGVARLTFTVRGPAISDLWLDLSDALKVDSAHLHRALDTPEINGIRERGHLRFPLAGPSREGNTYIVSVWYHGRPVRRAIGFGEGAGAMRAASYGLPLSAREWWPTTDTPAQKADSADIRITGPAALVAASNGRFVDRTVASNGTTATAHWSVRHPIYSDVVSFAVGDYVVLRDTAHLTAGRKVPLEYYVFPEDTAKARTDFTSVPRILRFLEEQLGPYPFADEKYALAEMARPSFREGQTITNLGAANITGLHQSDQVIAHEVSHQWFGNSLTVREWEDIWLHESLAEFMAWQWIRAAEGEAAYQALFDQAKADDLGVPMAPASVADFKTLFGVGTFLKGPIVISMLRDVLGDAAFAAALHTYVSAHAYGSVDGLDFEQACERASGKSLDWFFQQWVRDTVVPRLTLSWSASDGRVAARLHQHGAVPLRLLVPLIVTRADGSVSTRTAWMSARDESVELGDVGIVHSLSIDQRRQLIRVVP